MTSQPRWTQQTIAEEAYRAAVAALAAGPTSAGLAAMARNAAAVFDHVWAEIRSHVEAKGPRFACSAGCAWCCAQAVTISPAAAIAIAEYVRANFSSAALAALNGRLAALDERARGLGTFARGYLKTSCAFLVDGKCSIYDVRPIRCRSVYSRDVAHCQWVAENPDSVFRLRDQPLDPSPYPPEPAIIADAVLDGLVRAATEAGLRFDGLELTAALRIALETPDVGERFLRGEDVFAAAKSPDASDAGLADVQRGERP